ncbi:MULTISPECIES: hemerythrin domain-containing protein [Sphingomonas]|uniref:hemerythrin domain-containing protein n=1 Tax=Sphingomonas TaxID=13687 RepID=UPI00082D0118|nr:hemerythrin domain-containing protein [Sphingomonas sp. CCH10-B3]
MSILDKTIAALTPPESEEARQQAREKASALAVSNDWLAEILDHHREIETLFAHAKAAATVDARRAALKQLGTMLTAHAVAEEAAIYPALAAQRQVGHAELAYQEQSAAKMELGLLERLDPMSEDFADKLGHIEGAVAHHVYSEEGTWFAQLAEDLDAGEKSLVTARYREEFDRYMGPETSSAPAMPLR